MKTGPAAMAAARALGLNVPKSSSPGVAEVFSVPTRRELAEILPGGMEAARRIEADCCLLLNHGLHERSPEEAVSSARKLLSDADAMAKAAGAMVAVYEATEQAGGLRLLVGIDESMWRQLFVQIGDIAGKLARQRDLMRLSPAFKPGRRMAPGMSFIGANLCSFLEREGIRRSSASSSKMVRAVDVVLRGLGFENDAQAFVRTVLRGG
jgi:hypothetical protein